MVLVNARLSARSRAAWRRRPATARYVLDCFDLILTQNDEMARAMVEMNAPSDRVARGINLKALAEPLPQDSKVLATLRTSLMGRPVWVAASTHSGEEQIVLRAHKALRDRFPDLLLLLAPRHPDRGEIVSRLVTEAGFTCASRSKGVLPGSEAVYVADTMGELGNWYALTHAIFLGGSLVPVGGHNPFEVVQSGSGVLSGPEVFNFSETYAEMVRCGAARIVTDDRELTEAVAVLITDRETVDEVGRTARELVRRKTARLSDIARRLLRALGLAEPAP
jgi:3-deoxy-D-manno-octulosonic-acid transferase